VSVARYTDREKACVDSHAGNLSGTKILAGRGLDVFIWFFVCCCKTRKTILHLPPWEGSKTPESISTRTEVQTTYVPKTEVQPMYVPTEVNVLQVDGLVRISGFTQAQYKVHPQPPNIVPRCHILVSEREKGKSMNDLVNRNCNLSTTKQNYTRAHTPLFHRVTSALLSPGRGNPCHRYHSTTRQQLGCLDAGNLSTLRRTLPNFS